MSFGMVFLVLAIGFLGVIALTKTSSHKKGAQLSVKHSQQPKAIVDTAPVRGDELATWPFAPMPIMTDTEVIFFHKLQNALPEYYIFVQVQLSRIIASNADEASERSFWFNRICRQSIDYVIVDTDAQTTLVAIELDDWTHNSPARQKADNKKDKALTSAGIAIVRFHAERMPSADLLRSELLSVIKRY